MYQKFYHVPLSLHFLLLHCFPIHSYPSHRIYFESPFSLWKTKSPHRGTRPASISEFIVIAYLVENPEHFQFCKHGGNRKCRSPHLTQVGILCISSRAGRPLFCFLFFIHYELSRGINYFMIMFTCQSTMRNIHVHLLCSSIFAYY